MHSRVRIKYRESQHLWSESEFPGNHLEWRGLRHISRMHRKHGMAGHALRLRQTFSVIGVGSARDRHKEHAEYCPTESLQTFTPK
jgi:hypothetical protein